jgi:hypothetical protein
MRASIMPMALARLLLKIQTFKHSRDKSVGEISSDLKVQRFDWSGIAASVFEER